MPVLTSCPHLPCSVLSLLPEIQIKMTFGLPDRDANSCLEAAMLFSMVWAFEASLPPKTRAFFNILVSEAIV